MHSVLRFRSRSLAGAVTFAALAILVAARPAAAGLLVGDSTHVQRYNGATGAFANAFIPAGMGGLGGLQSLILRPDGNLYVLAGNTQSVLRYNGTTGVFVDTFVTAGSGGLLGATKMQFGPDGSLYIADNSDNSVRRYNGTTGASMGVFVASGSGGLNNPSGLAFGPDGNLYVCSATTFNILRYNGTTGAFIDVFVPIGAGGLGTPFDLIFGPDGNLYVTDFTNNEIMRYNGTTGASLNPFIPPLLSGLTAPTDLAFGPDGSLFVLDSGGNTIQQYNGATGVSLGTFVAAGSGGLGQPQALLFLPPTAPTGLITNASYLTVNLSWTDNSEDETAFAVWRKGGGSDWARIAVLIPNTTSYTDAGLTGGVAYTYRVRAISNAGASSWTNETSATPWPLLPAPPTGLTATTASAAQINLGWTSSGPNVASYFIWHKTSNSDWTLAAVVGPSPTTYADTGLISDTGYSYRVRAVNSYYASDWSNEADAWTAAAPPAAPTGLAASVVSHSQINLSWTDHSNNETAFSIWRKTGSGTYARIGVVAPHSTTYADTTVSSSTAYTYRVRATNNYFPSDWSNEATATTGP